MGKFIILFYSKKIRLQITRHAALYLFHSFLSYILQSHYFPLFISLLFPNQVYEVKLKVQDKIGKFNFDDKTFELFESRIKVEKRRFLDNIKANFASFKRTYQGNKEWKRLSAHRNIFNAEKSSILPVHSNIDLIDQLGKQ